jgi:hypothetical protein
MAVRSGRELPPHNLLQLGEYDGKRAIKTRTELGTTYRKLYCRLHPTLIGSTPRRRQQLTTIPISSCRTLQPAVERFPLRVDDDRGVGERYAGFVSRLMLQWHFWHSSCWQEAFNISFVVFSVLFAYGRINRPNNNAQTSSPALVYTSCSTCGSEA